MIHLVQITFNMAEHEWPKIVIFIQPFPN